MAKLTPAERQAAIAYANAVDSVTREWQPSQRRGEALFEQLSADNRLIADEEWRSTAIAEFRSWRSALSDIPADVPEVAQGFALRVQRWFAGLVALGDEYAAGIEAQDWDRLHAADRKALDEVVPLKTAADRSAKALNERLRQPRRRR
jgi:hypothetical protein